MHSPLWGPCTSYGYGISGVSLRRFSASNHHLLMHNFRRTCFRTTAQLPSQTSFTLPRTRLLYAHPLSSRHTQCQFHTSCRQWSWFPRFGTQKNHEPQNEPSDLQEEAAKAAILEKAMKGRQPTDLLLRCEFSFSFFPLISVPPTHVPLIQSENRHRIGRRRSVTHGDGAKNALFGLMIRLRSKGM